MKTKVGDLMVDRLIRVGPKDKISAVMRKIGEARESMLVCVVDDNDKLKGIITPRKLLKTLELVVFRTTRNPTFEWGDVLSSLTTRYAEDIMEPVISVRPEDYVRDAIDLMLDKALYELPVVDRGGKVLGEIYFYDIMACWAKDLRKVTIRPMASDAERWRARLGLNHPHR
ncbi:MAG: CBS domain-containing protein [Chloroflexi bacterium]|nr:CBS domain-containing protein [Chloroflexota bacterium]